MRANDIRDYEYKAEENGYAIKVKVSRTGETVVTLSNKDGNVFEGDASPRISYGYAQALSIAVSRMVAFVRRYEEGDAYAARRVKANTDADPFMSPQDVSDALAAQR